MRELQEYCTTEYNKRFIELSNHGKTETDSQRIAIGETYADALAKYPTEGAATIWKAIQSAHVHRKAGLTITAEQITLVDSAIQSWKKSSGHSAESSFCDSANQFLKEHKVIRS